jgi:hypothetical protein
MLPRRRVETKALLGNHCPEPLPGTTARNRCTEPMPGGGQQRQSRHSRDPYSRELGSDELGSCGAKEHSREFGSEELLNC